MCRLIKSIRPVARTGICLLVMPDTEPEWKQWSPMKSLRELDILTVGIYSPENFLMAPGANGPLRRRAWECYY